MILNKSLLLKCLGGVAACTGVAGVGIFGSQIGTGSSSSGKEPKYPPATIIANLSTLIAKVGLSGCTSTDSGSNECSIDSLKVKQGDKKEENKTKNTAASTDSPSGKIKVYSVDQTEGYENNFKFVIEDGDITLTGSQSEITKLEQFETYEIKEETEGTDKKWYFSRKKKAAEGIKETLGLPESCNLVDTVDCADKVISSTNISSLKFDGLNPGQNPSIQGTAKLTVAKLSSSDSDFPFGYKFTFQGKDADATINLGNNNTITLKQNEATEFRIKKGTSGNNITLEEAWTKERLLEKVNLSCTNDNTCTVKDSGTINIKQDNEKLDNKTLGTSDAGKIKLYTGTDTTGYNKGFKFVIEEGDITVGSDASKKLEQFETYEIKKEDNGNNWYFSRKTKAAEGIKTALGLPNDCTLPENTNESSGSNCNSLSSENLKTINFDGKQEGEEITTSGTASLTITKVSDTNYPFGYKFSIQPTQKLTISTGNTENSIAPNIGVEFKIKKTDNSNQISLEKAWSLETLAAKVGLENCNDSNGCSVKDGSLNVKHDDTKETSKTKDSSTSPQGKIKVYKDASGYKEGFKFVIEDGDINLTGSTNTISKLEQFETYEIEEADGKYYLSRKTKAFSEISKALNLPDGCNQLDSSNQADCSNLDQTKLKRINFEGKSSGEVTIEDGSNSKINLKVSKTTDTTIFPHGYKFVLESDKKITIPQSSSTTSIELKKNTNTEFKIKVTTSTSGGAKTLSLEKAWDITKLAEKVGLSCTSNGNKECTLTSGKKINVFNETSSYITDADFGTNDQSKKITFEEGVEGYNQGIKFTATDEITLNNGSKEGTIEKIEKKDGSDNPSYEIKEQTVSGSSKWFLSKHKPAVSK